MDPSAVSSLLTEAGPWVLLVVGLMTGWLVPKWVHAARVTELKADRDFYKSKFFSVLNVADKSVSIAEKVVEETVI